MSDFKYQTLQQTIEEGIKSGVYTDKLPSVRNLAKTNQVSIATVQKCYETLERMGLIEAKPKRGYFVCSQSKSELDDYGSDYYLVEGGLVEEEQVLSSLNDESLITMSSTAPSSVVNNEPIISKHHKKVFDKSIYQYQVNDEIQGSSSLRQTLSQFLLRQGQQISPADLHIVSGRREGLLVALIGTQSVGGTIAVESPTSFYFKSVVSRVCKNVVEIPLQTDFQQELALLDAAYLEHKFSTYLVNPSFQDPTGRLLSDSNKLDLLNWAKRRQVTLIEYDRSELYLGSCKPKSLTHLAREVKGVSVVGIQDFFDTISTRINMGFLLTVNTADMISNAQHTVTEEANLHTQNILQSLIHSGQYEKLLDKLRTQLRQNYFKTQQLLIDNLPDSAKYRAIKGGPCLWFKSEQKSSLEIWRILIEQGVAIAPGNMFGFHCNFEDYFRITFALPWNTELALAIKKTCKALE